MTEAANQPVCKFSNTDCIGDFLMEKKLYLDVYNKKAIIFQFKMITFVLVSNMKA